MYHYLHISTRDALPVKALEIIQKDMLKQTGIRKSHDARENVYPPFSASYNGRPVERANLLDDYTERVGD